MEFVYNILSGICILSSVICVFITANLALQDKEIHGIIDALKWRPLRSGILLVSIWELLGILAVVFLFARPIDDWEAFIRYTFINFAFTVTSVAILWVSFNIETGKVEIINHPEDEDPCENLKKGHDV